MFSGSNAATYGQSDQHGQSDQPVGASGRFTAPSMGHGHPGTAPAFAPAGYGYVPMYPPQPHTHHPDPYAMHYGMMHGTTPGASPQPGASPAYEPGVRDDAGGVNNASDSGHAAPLPEVPSMPSEVPMPSAVPPSEVLKGMLRDVTEHTAKMDGFREQKRKCEEVMTGLNEAEDAERQRFRKRLCTHAETCVPDVVSEPTVEPVVEPAPKPTPVKRKVYILDGRAVKNVTPCYVMFSMRYKALREAAGEEGQGWPTKPKEKWNTMTEEQKRPFVQLRDADSARYAVQKAQAIAQETAE